MLILGIDPGMAIVGYSVLKSGNSDLELVSSGSIQTCSDKSTPQRLLEIYEDMCTIIEKFKPDISSIEKLFYFKNQKTIIPVAEARGVILMALEKYKIPIYEFTPLEVKQNLTGFGRADKKEVEKMVKITLNQENLPTLDDTVDSIAMAICCHRCCVNSQLVKQ
ncbi:crossover junction endodeoxyribonuclease RuvC [bacterium]|nr:crossover junction endodeoxyribonuclease RuvC [bacterium]